MYERPVIEQEQGRPRPSPVPAFEGQDIGPAQRRLDAELVGTQPGMLPPGRLSDCIVPDATLVIGPSVDGAIAGSAGNYLPFSTTFTSLNQTPAMEPGELPPQCPGLPPLFVGFDGAWWNWYHWNLFALRRMALAQQLLPRDVRIAVPSGVMERRNWRNGLEALGLGDRVMVLEPGRYRVPRLHVLLTASPNPTDIVYLEAFHDAVQPPRLAQTRLVAIHRSHNTRLEAAQTDALSAVASRLGMEQVDLEQHSFEDQRSLFAGAALVVGAHGAGLSNLMSCRAGTRVLELNRRLDGEPQTRPWFYQIAAMRGLPYMVLDGDRGEVTEAGIETAIRRLMAT